MARLNKSMNVALSAVVLIALAGCGKKTEDDSAATTANAPAAGTAAPASAAAPAKDSIDTLDGTKFASFTGNATAGEKVFLACKTCHAVEPGKNMTGPSMHAIQGRTAGTIAGYSYSVANKNSGILWTNEKLFQYLENPQRVIVGTKMTYTGVKDPQQRADLIAYLDTLK